MANPVTWNQREEVDWLDYTIQPPLGILKGDYYAAEKEFGQSPGVGGHHGKLEVVVDDGKIVFVEFNERAMDCYYNQYFAGRDKRRSDYGIWQASKSRLVELGVVLVNGMMKVESQIMKNQSLDGDFELLTGASGSMKNMVPMAKKLAPLIGKPSSRRFYSIAEDFTYGLTGWLRVIIEDGQIISCRYDELFADHQKDIWYPELKQYYRQSKAQSPCYADPFAPGYDRHCWNINFVSLMDMLESRVLERQALLPLDGLYYLEGRNCGAMWDKRAMFDEPVTNKGAVRYPSWDNYERLAKQLTTVLPKPFGGA
ncbi:MAG: hypothetical protein LBV27_01955 [Oscillospiraceae bacterium]|jgi:major membrane immunogen (membrane-anchored lipoprotein)|nr:hypothetical protein [Oscillospiraceae bacterium]